MDEHQARSWLSEPRYGRFLEAAEGNHERAVALYEWHTRLTVASFGLIHHFEILLRNAIDGALGAGQPQTPIKDTWLLDFEILQPDGIKQVITALERLERGKIVTRGRIVAGLSFGFWAGLFGRRYEGAVATSSPSRIPTRRAHAQGPQCEGTAHPAFPQPRRPPRLPARPRCPGAAR